MSTCHGLAQIQQTGKYICPPWGLSKSMDVRRGKELGPILKQNTSDKKSTPATYIDIVALQYVTGNWKKQITEYDMFTFK